MTRRYVDTVTERYQDMTHHLECPRCGHHSVVSRGEGKYACIKCGWRRDISNNWDAFPLFVIIIIVLMLLIASVG